MSVQETNGYLDVENATLRSSKIEVTSNLAIGNTNPQHAFSVGSNLYVDTESSNVLSVKGNVVTEGIKMGFLEIIPSYDFAAVSNVGNVTANTIIFTNDNQGFVATGNATIGSTLTISGFRITAAAAAEDDLDAITTSTDDKPNAGTTQNPIHLEGATTATSYTTGILQVGNSTNRGGMGVAGNVYVNQGVYTQDLSAENVVSNLAVNTDDLFVDIVNSRVGIGKTEPTVALDVVGAVTTSSALTVGANFAVNTDDLFVDTVNSRVGIGKTEPTVALDVVGAVSTSGDLTVTGTSKVGIGTDTLDAVLNVGSGTLASGDQILKLNTDSPWAFEHETDGLALRSSAANKKLYVQASDFSNVATFDVTTSNVGIGLTDPASKLHVMGDIIGRNVSNTHTIAGTDGVTDTFTLLPDQNRIVVTHVGSAGADGAYTVNMTDGIPTTIGSILYLEIVSSKTNTDGSSHTHSTTLQIAADTVLTTGPITVAAVNNAGDVYERTLRRTIIRTSDGWKDYSVYPKVSVPTTDDAIIFSTTENTTQDTAGSDKPLTERLRITGYGRVGIGTASPEGPLHVYGDADETNAPLRVESADRYSGVIFHDSGGGVQLGADNGTLRILTDYAADLSGGVEVARITENELKIKAARNSRIFIEDTGTDSGTYYQGLYIGSPVGDTDAGMRMVVSHDSNTSGNRKNIIGFTNRSLEFNNFSDNDITSGFGTNRMIITSSGNVGIGKTDPGYTLDVNGSAKVSAGMYIDGSRYTANYGGEASSFYHPGTVTVNPASYNYTLTLQYACRAEAYVSYSDRRIKENIEDIDDASALEILRNLKPKKYTYKDTIKRGDTPVWGFIAQEVRETLPYATNLTIDSIPNIYELANVSQSNVITFTNFNTTNFENTLPTLKFMTKENNVEYANVTSIINEYSVSVDKDLSEWCGVYDEATNDVVSGDKIFVYGEEVSDFVSLNKDAIFTIATASVQELDRQLQAEKTKVTSLETQLTSVLARLDALESA
jgi:hypothetical protein